MTHWTTQARPYARAAFEYAKQHNVVGAWQAMLQIFAGLTMRKQIINYLNNPKISTEDILAFFAAAWPDGLNAAQKNFLLLLIGKNQLKLLPDIASLVNHFVEQQNHVEPITVQSATALSPAQQEKLQHKLSQRLNKKVQITYAVKPELIGGAIIRTPEWVMDGSVKNKLQQLKTQLVG